LDLQAENAMLDVPQGKARQGIHHSESDQTASVDWKNHAREHRMDQMKK
jgi:hypothetical protein